MGVRLTANHQLPADPHYLTFTRTDGDESRLPRDTTKVVDSAGEVNFMRPIPVSESACINWRKGIGIGVAKQLGMPDGPKYTLEKWPEGYHMYDHNKGPESKPRHDLYLVGSAYVGRFRSIPEFIPHAVWLMTDETLNRANCSCKYCSKNSQRDISASMGLVPSSQSPRPTRNPRNPRGGLPDARYPLTTIVQKPRLPELLAAPTKVILAERVNDVTAAYASKGHKVKRWFREGELVWLDLKTPIQPPSDDESMSGSSIRLWPALVESSTLKTFTSPLDPQTQADPQEEGASFSVEQRTDYKLRLLGVLTVVMVPDTDVLPYLAYEPGRTLIDDLQALIQQHLERFGRLNEEAVAAFRPIRKAGEAPPTLEEAAVPFALAVEISKNLLTLWIPTDDWKPEAPSRRDLSKALNRGDNSSPSNGTSVSAAINASTRHNAQVAAGRSSEHTQKMHFQGLWWGAERIWVDELVRLRCYRRDFLFDNDAMESTMPHDSPGQLSAECWREKHLLPPAPPSKAALDAQLTEEDVAYAREHGGSESRGVFMRINAVFQEEYQRGFHCMLLGDLYELVDEDWEETAPDGGRSEAQAGTLPDSLPTAAFASVAGTRPPEDDKSLSTRDTANSLSSSEASKPKRIYESRHVLPPAPKSFKWRRFTEEGHQIRSSVQLIAGRYYPNLDTFPLVQEILSVPDEREQQITQDRLGSLVGLMPGILNAMPAENAIPDREAQVQEVHRKARAELAAWIQRKGRGEDEMEEEIVEEMIPVTEPDDDIEMDDGM